MNEEELWEIMDIEHPHWILFIQLLRGKEGCNSRRDSHGYMEDCYHDDFWCDGVDDCESDEVYENDLTNAGFYYSVRIMEEFIKRDVPIDIGTSLWYFKHNQVFCDCMLLDEASEDGELYCQLDELIEEGHLHVPIGKLRKSRDKFPKDLDDYKI